MSEARLPETTEQLATPPTDVSNTASRFSYGLRPSLAALAVILACGLMHSPCHAGGFPSYCNSFARWFGVGFGDGYHRCPGQAPGIHAPPCFRTPCSRAPCPNSAPCFETPCFEAPCAGGPGSCSDGQHSSVWTSSRLPQPRMTRIPERRTTDDQTRQESPRGWHYRDWPQ